MGKGVLRVERTEYFQPKSEESAGEIDLAAGLIGLMQAWKVGASSEFVIVAPNPPRYDAHRTNYRAQREFENLGR